MLIWSCSTESNIQRKSDIKELKLENEVIKLDSGAIGRQISMALS